MSDYNYNVYDLHRVFVRGPDDGVEDLKAYHIRILSTVLGSDEAADKAYMGYFHDRTCFTAYFPPDKARLLQEHPSVIEVIQKFHPPPTNPDEDWIDF